MKFSTSFLLLSVTALPAFAQGLPDKLHIDPKTSLAWWQVNPHYGHLWATTCPTEPSWQPGEGRTLGMLVDYSWRPKTVDAGRLDSRIPLYPRKRVHSVCAPAVRGELDIDDTLGWKGVRGWVAVAADKLITGLDMRDKYARTVLLDVSTYPDIRLQIDSVVSVQPGDTTRAVAVGTFQLRGVKQPVRVPVKFWREASGLRVQGQFMFPPKKLIDVYGMSRAALELGVVVGRWQEIHWGADLIFVPGAAPER